MSKEDDWNNHPEKAPNQGFFFLYTQTKEVTHPKRTQIRLTRTQVVSRQRDKAGAQEAAQDH